LRRKRRATQSSKSSTRRSASKIPFNASNYFYGITKVGFWPYVLAIAGGMLPGTLLYVYLGAAGKAGLGGGSKEHSSLEYLFFGVGLVATIGVSQFTRSSSIRACVAQCSFGATSDIRKNVEVERVTSRSRWPKPTPP